METYDGEMDQGDPDGDFFWGVFHPLSSVACCILHLQPVKISNFLTLWEKNYLSKNCIYLVLVKEWRPPIDLRSSLSGCPD